MAPRIPNALTQLADKLANNPILLQRLLLVGVLWGSVSFAWGSITENALANRLPTLFDHATRTAAEVSAYLERSTDVLTPLTEDPRLIVGLSSNEGVKSTSVSRAMYEFSYLNKLNRIWVYSSLTGEAAGLAASGPMPANLVSWLKSLPGSARGSAVVMDAQDESRAAPYAFYIAKPIPGSNGGLAVARLSWQNLLNNWPPRATISGFAKAQQGLLGTGGDSKLWLPLGNPSEAAIQKWFSPTPTQTDYLRDATGDVWVWSTVPNQKGWRVAIRTPIHNALGEGGTLRWLLVLGTLAATAALLWMPTRPIRKKVQAKARKYTDPIKSAGGKAFAPAFSAARKVGTALKKEQGAPLAQPGQFDAHDFKSGNRKISGITSGGSGPTVVGVKRPPMGGGGTLGMVGSNAAAAAPAKPASAISMPDNKPRPVIQPKAPTVEELLGHKEDPLPNPAEFTPTMEEMVDQAILNRRVKLLYQPIYELGTGLPVYHEVLARLGDPAGNWMTPQVFIPILQKNKWFPRLDALVFGKILTDYGTKKRPETPLTLNISGATMDNIRYLSKVQELKGVPVMQNLMFEISSQELLADPSIIKLLLSTKAAGVKLAVDYFGGGPNMLEASKNMGFDFVKINTMRFSQDDAGKKDLIVLCRTAQRIGLPVVLEKIETMSMELFARKLNVSYLQGYQLSRPLESMTNATLPSWRANADMDKSDEPNS